MSMTFSRKKTELTNHNWLEKIPETKDYTLCFLNIGDSVSQLTDCQGSPSEIKKDQNNLYEVYYYNLKDFKIGFQMTDSTISGFTLINQKDGISKSDILNKLGPIPGQTLMIGQIFSMLDYEIDGFIYDYDAFDLKIKVEQNETTVSTFYFGKNWTKIALETFPSEIY